MSGQLEPVVICRCVACGAQREVGLAESTRLSAYNLMPECEVADCRSIMVAIAAEARLVSSTPKAAA